MSEKILSPLKAIGRFCFLCQGESRLGVKQCVSEKTCPLWPYRTGHGLPTGRTMTEEQKEAARQLMQKINADRGPVKKD